MDMSWAVKDSEESGMMTPRPGALATSKRVGCSQNGSNCEHCSALPVGNPLLSKDGSGTGSGQQAFDEFLLKENMGPALKKSQCARRNGCTNRSLC